MLDSSHEVLSKEEEYELAVAMKGGCSKSREKLITHNIRLVHKVANKFVTPVEHDDLVMAGIQGLIKCLDTFEPEKGFKLSTYAHSQIFWAIKHSLAKAPHYNDEVEYEDGRNSHDDEVDHDQESLLHDVFALLDEKERYVLRCVEMHGRSANELAEAMGISGERVRQIRRGAIRKIQNTFRESPKWEHLF